MLYNVKTGKQIEEGDEIEVKGKAHRVSGIDSARQWVFVIDAEADGNPFRIPAAHIGAAWR